jgi:putative membrane protein
VIKFLVKVVLMAVVFYLVARYVPGIEVQTNPNAVLGISITFAWLALLFAVVNAIVGPILRFLSFPAILLSLGLFYLIINAALFGLTAGLSSRLDVDGFGAAVLGGLAVAVASWVFDLVLDRR